MSRAFYHKNLSTHSGTFQFSPALPRTPLLPQDLLAQKWQFEICSFQSSFVSFPSVDDAVESHFRTRAALSRMSKNLKGNCAPDSASVEIKVRGQRVLGVSRHTRCQKRQRADFARTDVFLTCRCSPVTVSTNGLRFVKQQLSAGHGRDCQPAGRSALFCQECAHLFLRSRQVSAQAAAH
jgi:hypothetical protein